MARRLPGMQELLGLNPLGATTLCWFLLFSRFPSSKPLFHDCLSSQSLKAIVAKQGLKQRYGFCVLQVMWRRNSDPNPLIIGSSSYVQPNKYAIQNSNDPREWNLEISNVQPSDAGVYECQVPSKRVLKHHVLLNVNSKYLIACIMVFIIMRCINFFLLNQNSIKLLKFEW